MSELDLQTIKNFLKKNKDHDWKASENPVVVRLEQDPNMGTILFGSSVKVEKLKEKPVQEIMFGYGSSPKLPRTWDWRKDHDGGGWVTSIKDQGGCGSCVAFGTIAALESCLKIQYFQDASMHLDFSEAFLFFCLGQRKCPDGWLMDLALDCIMRDGVPPEGCFPYRDHDMDCSQRCENWMDLVGPTKDITYNYTANNIEEMKRRLKEYGPQIAAMEVWADFPYYRRGVYKPIPAEDGNYLRGHHCICVIGYDDEKQCWICKNSWGRDWGDEGYFQMDYTSCRLVEYGFYTIVAHATIDRKVVNAFDKLRDVYYFDTFESQPGTTEQVLKLNQNNEIFLEKLALTVHEIRDSGVESKVKKLADVVNIQNLLDELDVAWTFIEEKRADG